MRADEDGGTGTPGPSFAHPVATPGPTAGVDSMSKSTVDGLPATVSTDETLRRNQALWPVATQDAAKDSDKAEERPSEKGGQ